MGHETATIRIFTPDELASIPLHFRNSLSSRDISPESEPTNLAHRLSSLNQSTNALPVFSEVTRAVDIQERETQLPDPILLTPTHLGVSVDENRTTRIGVPAPTAEGTWMYRLYDWPGFCDCPGCRREWGTEDGADRGLR
ncbi:hypothetical protein QR685DRAFT_569038 [Neurospora intermedia]|uniref:Uncharacterized protein n=1 Tax=Neurospora intermedia TaxID=5142 RepID=A0ABR3DJP3_NEUIN